MLQDLEITGDSGCLTLSVQFRRRKTEASSHYLLCASMPEEAPWEVQSCKNPKVGNIAMVATDDATGLFFLQQCTPKKDTKAIKCHTFG